MLPPRCHLGSRTSNLGHRTLDLGPRTSDLGPRTSDLGSRISDLGSRTSNLGPRTSDLGPRTSNLGPRTSNLEPRTSDLGPRVSDLEPRTSDLGIRTSDLEPRTSNLRDNLLKPTFFLSKPAFFPRCFCVFPSLHGCWACWFTWVYVVSSWIFLAKMLSIPRLHVGSMLDLPPWSWVLVGSMSMLICYVGPICWSMLDLLRCPQMCSKASIGAIGFMLDVSHVGHIFLFLISRGSPPKYG